MASEPGANEPSEPGRVVGGRYRLVRRLAEGGMGEVWLARHEGLDSDVAVKLMSAEIMGTEHALARFEREAKASAKLKSNHIVRVHDYGVDGDTPYMVMELLDGEDLGTRLKRRGPMTVAELAPVLRQIAKGLEVAHAAGFVHRDLKPSNIFIAHEGGDEIVKVVDFGVARETKTKLVDEKTGSGVVLGSPHHMSPEQALGEKVDHRSDLWALAVVVYRALAGRKPFDSDVLATLLLEIVSKPVPKITEVAPDVPAEMNRFFARALHRKPSRRFQSATAMADALEAIVEGEDITPFLTVPDAVPSGQGVLGREEATAPSLDPADIPRAEPRDERTASRALTAVTAGVPSLSVPGSSRRPLLLGAIVLALVVGAFFVGRSGMDQDAESVAGDGTSSVDEVEQTAVPAPAASEEDDTPDTEPAPAASVTAAPTASASVTGPSVVSRPVIPKPVAPRPRPAPASVPAPKPAPKVDPFTGIATP